MTFYRGLSGYVALGGYLSTQSGLFVNGTFAAGASSINLDGNGGHVAGWIAPNDTFTIAGESGSPVHVVATPGGNEAAGDALNGVIFSPVIAAGGVADNAAVTVAATAVAQIVAWQMDTTLEEIDSTVMGNAWKAVVGGLAQWAGQFTARLDYGDARQKALVDRVLQGTSAACYLTLGSHASGGFAEQFEGAACLYRVQVQSQMGQLVTAVFQFTGSNI